ncbi:MAG: N-acetylmuramoyl-L-alanine amidase [Byssovorax sp.]
MIPRVARLLGPVLLAGAMVAACSGIVARSLSRRGSSAGHLVTSTSLSPLLAGTAWPSAATRLAVPAIVFPANFGLHRVYVDAGHGAAGNSGNTSCFCIAEEDFTLFAARELAARLEATGHFLVQVSRDGAAPVEYRDRVDEAARWGAEAFISLHSDVRSHADRWSPRPGTSCPVSYSAPGFSVIYSDDGPSSLVLARQRLARAAATRLVATGLLPYDGAGYAPLYDSDPGEAGVFLDRHPLEQRIFVLHRPTMAAILIETHHALDPREAERWEDDATLDAFSAALGSALVEALGKGPSEIP